MFERSSISVAQFEGDILMVDTPNTAPSDILTQP
jgi:hypothetical protein